MGRLSPRDLVGVKRDLSRGVPTRAIAERFGVPYANIQAHKQRMRLVQPGKQRAADWSEPEVERLRSLTVSFILEDDLLEHFPDRTRTALRVKLKRLSVTTVGRSGLRGIKWKQELYARIAEHYRTHTREETQRYCLELGLGEAFFKHWVWRTWPKMREAPKSPASAIRYGFKEHLAYLKLAATYGRNQTGRGFGGTFCMTKLAAKYPNAHRYWGLSAFEASRVSGFSLRALDNVTKLENTSKGFGSHRILSWKRLARVVRRQPLPEDVKRLVQLMARFEAFLTRATRRFKSPEDAMRHLVAHRSKYVGQGVNEAVKKSLAIAEFQKSQRKPHQQA